ncbi:MAG: hypothetical protein HRT70_07380 [Flavobacteriaceae bacterium]|nr:hypothetical protein [Flavobacteriaceae bacterium]
MKTVKKIQICIFATALITLNACVENDDFNTPISLDQPFTLGQNDIATDISAVLGEYAQQGEIFTYEDPTNGGNIYLSGYVISSDEGGNFFEEIVIQDSPSNPSAGIVVQVDVNPLFTYYEFGRKIWIKLNGLSVAESNGVIQIGFRNGNDLEKIPSAFRNEFIMRDAEIASISPLELSVAEFTNDKENLFIRLADVQFVREEVFTPAGRPLTFAGEASDEFDGERTLESCAGNATVILSTSTFSDFKSLSLPTTRGAIDGILTRDYFDDFYTLVINSPENINFDNEERCDPILLDCGLASAEGTTVLFEDDFESQTPFSPITGNGWTNHIEAGTESFEAYTSGGANASQGVSCRIGAYQSGDASSIAWLITPSIDLTANPNATITFQTSNSFSDNSELELMFSNDWDGTTDGISSATWGVVPAAYITQDSDFYGAWFDSGIVDLSCGEGVLHFAFKYTGSGASDFDGTYEIDHIRIAN